MKHFITAGQSLREPADAIPSMDLQHCAETCFCESHFLHFLFSVTSCGSALLDTHTHRHFGGCFLLYCSVLCCSKVYLFHRDTGQDSEYLFSPSHSPIDPGLLQNSWQRCDKCFVCFCILSSALNLTNPAVFLHKNSKRHHVPAKRLALLLTYLSICLSPEHLLEYNLFRNVYLCSTSN